ncbi:hypothetical protein F5884DRAFT_856848 [Xylogone sp. PMI_703]|nr:hypothetical protein F5884DRAFT_856848 [Xylogone sp. PMI_703]
MERYTALNQVDDEIEKSSLDPHIRTAPRRSGSPYLWFASGFIAALLAALIIALSYVVIHKKANPPGLIPDFPTVEVTFEPHPEYSNLTDVAATDKWYTMLHHGHIYVDDATRYSLKPGIPVSKHGERLIISGLHGLHCLRTLRNEITLRMLGHLVDTPTSRKHVNHNGRPDHCFDYLRQLILCNLDLTYESAREDLDGKRRVADGWGTIHQCKDWTAIQAWMMKNYEQEMSLEDWTAPDAHKPVGQDDLYGELYPIYDTPGAHNES